MTTTFNKGTIYLSRACPSWTSRLNNLVNPLFGLNKVYRALSAITKKQAETKLRVQANRLFYFDIEKQAWQELKGSNALAKRIGSYVGSATLKGALNETQTRLILSSLAKPLHTMVARLAGLDIKVKTNSGACYVFPCAWHDLYEQVVSSRPFFGTKEHYRWGLFFAPASALVVGSFLLSQTMAVPLETPSVWDSFKLWHSIGLATLPLPLVSILGYQLGKTFYSLQKIITSGPGFLYRRAKLSLVLRSTFREHNPRLDPHG